VYEGDWDDGKQQGVGMFQWKDGRKYEGQFKDGQIEGMGVLTTAKY